MKNNKPNPGSKEAIEQGCLCPKWDNNCGKGSYYGEGTFFISEKCPLHNTDMK